MDSVVNKLQNDSERVKEFTEKSIEAKCPNEPSLMTKEEVRFLINMMASELVEMAQTVCDSPEEAIGMVARGALVDLDDKYVRPESEVELIAEQADAAIDAWYYALNAFAKKGVNLSKIFLLVHEANMGKFFPDNTFHRDDRGKVIKPDGWKEADLVGEILAQKNDGTWS